MSNKRDRLPQMDPFSPAHQPDEGYSEDPLNPTVHNDLSAALATLRSPADLPAWLATNASLLPVHVKTELTMALLDELPTSVIADIVQRLNPRLYIDFIRYLPSEICLKILGYLDPVSLVSVTQTCRAWYDLALDRKLWERLYYMEGWKAVESEIEVCEARVNDSFNSSIGQLHRMQSSENVHPSKIRAILNDDDMDMSDSDRAPSHHDSLADGSIFGSPSSSFSSNRWGFTPAGDMDLDTPRAKAKSVDRALRSSGDSLGKRKEPGGDTEPSLPVADVGASLTRTSLWIWDLNSHRYRLNWKYLYNMRRRLESNWELGKYTTFQLPHPSFPEEGHQECVYALQFDGKYLVSGSRDQTMRVWNMKTRRLVRPPLIGHTGSVLCLQFDADPNEDILVSGSSDSNVFIWKFSTGELIQKLTRAHRESVLNVRFDKRILVTSSKDKTIKIFNRRPIQAGDAGFGNAQNMLDPVPTHMRMYGYEPDPFADLPVKPAFSMIGKLEGHSAAVNAIQIRDRTVVSVSGDRHIKVWNWPDQVCLQTIPAHDKGIACVEFDGRRIVSGSSDYEVCIFDAPTGLKVAQLRGHAHLVRTVQAGFGDLPYSKEDDEAEAKAVDAEYFRALEAGEISPDHERRRRRNRRYNPGSSRPEDVQAYGAKIPPGGGGGRKYGRIVSGSYDQSIIVWRRDKEGVWKPAHHLRQEEAAAAAQRQMTLGTPTPPAGNMSLHPSVRQLNTPMLPNYAPQLPSISQMMAGTPGSSIPNWDQHGGYPRTQMAAELLIDSVVPMGVPALQQALAKYPVILVCHDHLQNAIERESSPFVRSQLRQAVTDAVVAIQNGQAARQRGPLPSAPLTMANLAFVGGPSSSMAGSAGAGTSVPGPSAPSMSSAPAPMLNHYQINQPPVVSNAQPHGGPPGHGTPQQGTQHHPHLAAAENQPARVFKLQFDAHKIVCCSQAPIIVGWDFCNKDPELEEACRFFATVD